ncbi:MAG: tyrosine-type recombinase/integrase [Aureibaculum sp.]|nr:tyrosine-type recombinase/integrase [Aureibaculum sp.]
MRQLFSLMAEGHVETQSIMKEGFVGLAIQNAELNAELKDQNKALEEQLNQLQEQLEIVTQELQERKERERLLQEKKEKWKNRRRLPKREPITVEIYDSLIKSSQKLKYGNLYQSARLRLALALLLITGIRISELLPLKMNRVESLFTKYWISIDRAKRGPTNHKAFLTKEGSKIIKERRSDFEFLELFKESDSYIFTAENSKKPLSREAFTNLINKFMKDWARKMDPNPYYISSHSFRVGFITQFWRDTNDIEFVRQAIGHAKIDTTSQYLENLSEKERQDRMLEISGDKVENGR